jgi:hypothetical protein
MQNLLCSFSLHRRIFAIDSKTGPESLGSPISSLMASKSKYGWVIVPSKSKITVGNLKMEQLTITLPDEISTQLRAAAKKSDQRNLLPELFRPTRVAPDLSTLPASHAEQCRVLYRLWVQVVRTRMRPDRFSKTCQV